MTFAKQDADREDEVAGQGRGIVDEFDTAGNLIARIAHTVSSTRRGGSRSRRTTSAASAATCSSATSATVRSTPTSPARTAVPRTAESSERAGRKITIDGLWALEFGNGGNAGARNELFFTAGPDDESHGLFGKIAAG